MRRVLISAGAGGEADAKISMKWDKNHLPIGLLCEAAAGKGNASPITACRSRTELRREAERP